MEFFDEKSNSEWSHHKYLVECKSYIDYSYKLNWKEEDFPTCIIDGMCGEYSVFGLLLEYCDDDYDNNLDLEVTLKDIESLRIRLYNYCNEIKLQDCYDFGEPSLIIFTHYSWQKTNFYRL